MKKKYSHFSQVFWLGLSVILCFRVSAASSDIADNQSLGRFTGVKTSPMIEGLIEKKGGKFFQLFPLTNSHVNTNFIILRGFPSGNISIHYRSSVNSSYNPIQTPTGFSNNSYVMKIFGDYNEPYLLIYDVVKNIPSGRNLNQNETGYDLYQVKKEPTPHLALIKSGIKLGGIDTVVYGSTYDSKILLCAINQCASITPLGQINYWKLQELANFEFIELVFYQDMLMRLCDFSMTIDQTDLFQRKMQILT